MPSLKLLADDLTGALDTSAEFAGLFGPLDVFWSIDSIPADRDRFSIDSGTRELGSDGRWSAVGKTIIEQIRAHGLEARLGDPAAALQPAISVFDAETDEDLDRVVQIGRRHPGTVLWCGSGGLASALARGTGVGL